MKAGHNTKSDIAHLSFVRSTNTRHSLQFQWGIIPEEHLRSILHDHSTLPGVDEFLVLN